MKSKEFNKKKKSRKKICFIRKSSKSGFFFLDGRNEKNSASENIIRMYLKSLISVSFGIFLSYFHFFFFIFITRISMSPCFYFSMCLFLLSVWEIIFYFMRPRAHFIHTHRFCVLPLFTNNCENSHSHCVSLDDSENSICFLVKEKSSSFLPLISLFLFALSFTNRLKIYLFYTFFFPAF